uniref:Phosphate transport system permease protein PstA n=1 Tax=uncultured bacterium F25-01 TaxID=1191433 RepID=I3VIG0_9BACT|nr:phosphate transport system permease protein PstA [uncultured bacterium F25-01]
MSAVVKSGAVRRQVVAKIMLTACYLGLAIALVVLVEVLGYVILQGASSLNLAFFTNTPKPVGETGGGFANAIVGTLIIVGLAIIVGLPLGIGSGIYLAEYGRGRLATAVRFTADVLTGIPSITIGLFAYTLVVIPFQTFSAIAGGFALGIIMLPILTRTTEEMVRLVPASLREGAIALGVPRWRVVLSVVLPTALTGIATGVVLAIARVAGETAPLLFTAFGNTFWSWSVREPIAALPLQIFAYAIAPYDDWHNQAWAGALILVLLVLILSMSARALVSRRMGG